MFRQAILSLLTALLFFCGVTAEAHAALIVQEPVPWEFVVLDTSTDLIWLQDANLARTSGFDTDGVMDWSSAMAWADGLVYGGYSDWRLPTTPGTIRGYTSEGELGHLHSELGNPLGGPLTETGPFSNTQSYYWSDTEYAPLPISAWVFVFDVGYQYGGPKSASRSVWAVRGGGVSPEVIPEPASLLLIGSGLFGLIALRRQNP
jgi:hypothetical protein